MLTCGSDASSGALLCYLTFITSIFGLGILASRNIRHQVMGESYFLEGLSLSSIKDTTTLVTFQQQSQLQAQSPTGLRTLALCLLLGRLCVVCCRLEFTARSAPVYRGMSFTSVNVTADAFPLTYGLCGFSSPGQVKVFRALFTFDPRTVSVCSFCFIITLAVIPVFCQR